MTVLKMIASCLALSIATGHGLNSSALQDEGAQRAKNSAEKGSEDANRPPPPAFTQRDDYVVEPPDLIDLWVEEALPGRPIYGERLVRPDGMISVGWYGEIDAAGLTVLEIKIKLISLLQKFIRDEYLGLVALDASGNPVIDPATGTPKRIEPKDSKKVRVEITQCNSKVFYVQGEVWSPGRFPLTGTESLLGAIDIAGGLSPFADPGKVHLYRIDSQGKPECFTADMVQIKRGKLPSTDHLLKPGDRVVVDRRAGNGRFDEAVPPPDEVNASSHVSPDDPSLQHLEKRMTDLEHKLDLIIEAIKRRRP
jgi:polysaccharide biosynthesis/export protein